MSKIKDIEVFFLEYPFPKKLGFKFSGGLVENMIVAIIKVTDSNDNYESRKYITTLLIYA